MGIRADIVVLAAIVAGSAYAIVWQSRTPAATVTGRPALAFGEKTDDFVLKDIEGKDRNLFGWKGKEATVLYFWSTECPCIGFVEKRMKHLLVEFEPKGVSFIAVDSNPDDTRQEVLDHMVEIRAGYRMLLDPEQKIARRFGATKATELVVLDGEKRVRYRGGIDDSLEKPTKPYLRNAILAILEGREPDPKQTETEGCPFPNFDGVCATTD